MYAPLIVDGPAEPGVYNAEGVVVLDSWTDGVGRDPDAIAAQLKAGRQGCNKRGRNMSGMAWAAPAPGA